MSWIFYITNLEPIFVCGNSRTWCETKANQQLKPRSGWSYHWQEWNSNLSLLKQLRKSNFHNNFCRICKWGKENWNKYNTIYLTKLNNWYDQYNLTFWQCQYDWYIIKQLIWLQLIQLNMRKNTNNILYSMSELSGILNQPALWH